MSNGIEDRDTGAQKRRISNRIGCVGNVDNGFRSEEHVFLITAILRDTVDGFVWADLVSTTETVFASSYNRRSELIAE